MTPLTKSSRCSVIDRYFSTDSPVGPMLCPIQSITHSSRKTPKVAAPATIWFFVRLEMNRPTLMKQPPNRSSPR